MKVLYVSGWTIDGRGYHFAPSIKTARFSECNVPEKVRAALNRPPSTHERIGSENAPVRRVVYDVVEELLGESR